MRFSSPGIPPRGIHFTSVRSSDAPVLWEEIEVLLAKEAVEPVPPADMKAGFYSPTLTTTCTSGKVATPSPRSPADLGSLQSHTGRPVCLFGLNPLPAVLFPDRGHSLHGCTGAQLAPGPSQICVSPSEPSGTDPVQSQGGRGAGPVSCAILAQPDLVLGTHAPHDSPSLAHSFEEGPAFSETGLPLALASRPLEASSLVPSWDAEGTETYVPSPQSLYLRCTAESLARLLSGKANM